MYSPEQVLQLLNGERPDLDASPEEEPAEEPAPEPEPVERTDSSRLMFELANRAAAADEAPEPEPEPVAEEVPVEPKRRRKKTLTGPPLPPPLALVLPAKDLRSAVFRKVDVQANGLLTLAEASAAVSEIWPSFDRQPVLMRAYHAVQVTEAGQIGRKEFRRLLKYIVFFNSNWMNFEEVSELARASGGLGAGEFDAAVGRLGVKVTRSRPVESHFSALVSKGGIVRFDAFCKWCAERHIANDPDEQDAAKVQSTRRGGQKKEADAKGGPTLPPRGAGAAKSKPGGAKGGGVSWGQQPRRWTSEPTLDDVMAKREQRKQLKKGGGIRTAQTGHTPPRSVAVARKQQSAGRPKVSAKASAGKVEKDMWHALDLDSSTSLLADRRRLPSPERSRRGDWLHNATGHK